MGTWAGPEAACDDLLTYVGTNGAAKWTNIDARYSDSIVMADFAHRRHSRPMLDPEPALPVLFVAPIRGRMSWGVASRTGQHTGHYTIVVAWWSELTLDEGRNVQPSETMTRVNERYAIGLLEMIATNSGTNYEWGTGDQMIDVDYSPAFPVPDRDNTYQAGGRIIIGVSVPEAAL